MTSSSIANLVDVLMAKVVQINLKHSKCATDNLAVLLREEDIDLAIIQEPWVHSSCVKGLNINGYNLFYDKGQGKPRSCILAKTHLNAFLCSHLSSLDITTIRIERKLKPAILVTSAYMPHDDEAPPEGVLLVQNFAQTEKLALLMGCDANARHSLWGSSEINDRGESLFDFILKCNLEVCNKGNTPTFIFPSTDDRVGWEEVLDIALCSTSGSLALNDWRVSARNSFSNHKYIMFVM
ncbi:uncharacterized protein LOC119673149, partial [Teleopsis dalmanni]|uniref:uncharacterized protein LOC119672856 n=1 Tax=Teleopsis dalmanni TaxID=139649 RepID=UPI0018CD4AF1